MVHTERETVGVVCGENSNAVLANLFVERDMRFISVSDALEDLERCVAQPYPIEMTRKSFQFIGEALNEIAQEAVAQFKKEAKEQGKEWTGTVEFTHEPLEEPETPKQIKETVNVGPGAIRMFSESTYDLEKVEGESHVTLVLTMSPEGEILQKVDWIEKTEIEGGSEIESGRIAVRLSGKRVYSVEVKDYPDDLTAPQKKSTWSRKLVLS